MCASAVSLSLASNLNSGEALVRLPGARIPRAFNGDALVVASRVGAKVQVTVSGQSLVKGDTAAIRRLFRGGQSIEVVWTLNEADFDAAAGSAGPCSDFEGPNCGCGPESGGKEGEEVGGGKLHDGVDDVTC